MPPVRRYVRISPHSCLEVRIFVDNPADISTWLLRPSNPALPRVFSTVKPLILPKLREENERARLAKGKSGKKKKGVKDVVKGDDFEVVVFLTEGHGRHEVVVKRREAQFRESRKKMTSLAGAADEPVVIREEEDDDEEDIDMNDIPLATDADDNDDLVTTKAIRRRATSDDDTGSGDNFVDPYREEKKKLGFKTKYDGFSIWGKVLCLLVERKSGPARNKNLGDTLKSTTATGISKNAEDGAQQALMQEWISSTQMPQDDDDDD